jgi:hypothetical protein
MSVGNRKAYLLSVFGECDHIWLEKERLKAKGRRLAEY